MGSIIPCTPCRNDKVDFTFLKQLFLSRLQQAELYKNISGIEPSTTHGYQLQTLQSKLQDQKQGVSDQKLGLHDLLLDIETNATLLDKRLSQVMQEKEDLIDCIGKARIAEQEYNEYLEIVHPDQMIVTELIKTKSEQDVLLQQLESQVQHLQTRFMEKKEVLMNVVRRIE